MKVWTRNIFFLWMLFVFVLNGTTLKAGKGLPSTAAFIENRGQIIDQDHVYNQDVLFLYSGNGVKIQLRKTGYSYELFDVNNLPTTQNGMRAPVKAEAFLNTSIRSHRVDLDLIGMSQNFEIVKEQKNETVLNYVINGAEMYGVHSYKKVTYKNVYDNVDIEFVLTGIASSPLKYNIILHPGADIKAVQFLCRGALDIKKDVNGHLTMLTSLGDITETIPYSFYTNTPSLNQEVNFKLAGNIISFSAIYDKSLTLVIDPSSNLIWGTYFGGSAAEYCTSTGSDASNNVYIAGYSLSTSNIATSGVYQSTLTGSFDGYVARFNSNGVQAWGTYFGGSSFDIFYAMHVLPSGIVYAAGDTGSNSGVASSGAHQTIYGGGIDDALLVKFDANGQRLWSTYNGGTMHDISQDVTVDGNGDVIIVGHTESTSGIATSGAYNTIYSLNFDVLISKFNSSGVRQWGTYYGETGVDEAYGVTCDASNNIFVTGLTNSLFGISAGTSFQANNAGNVDGYIAKFDPAGVNLIWGTYYGGSGDDKGISIKTDLVSGNVYLGGNTTSTNNISGSGAYQPVMGSVDDAFITAFTNSGSRIWGTYYGGNDVDYINCLILDPDKNILVCGQSLSTNAMSSTNAYQANIAVPGLYDAYFAKFSDTGERKLATYFGGNDNDNAHGITVDGLGRVYLAGQTSSTVSISTPGSHMPVYAGGFDAFLAKFCVAPEPTVTPLGTSTTCVNSNYTLTASPGYTAYAWNTSASVNPLVVTSGSVAGIYYYAVTVTDAFGCEGTSDSSIVIVNLCTGMDELEHNFSFNVFPVPAHNEIKLNFENISLKDKTIIELYSSGGAMVFKEETTESVYSIDRKNISAGLYFIRCRHGDRSFEKKIVFE